MKSGKPADLRPVLPDQRDLFRAVPTLELLLPFDRFFDIEVERSVNQRYGAALKRITLLIETLVVFGDPSFDIVRNANVEVAVLAAHHVDPVGLRHKTLLRRSYR